MLDWTEAVGQVIEVKNRRDAEPSLIQCEGAANSVLHVTTTLHNGELLLPLRDWGKSLCKGDDTGKVPHLPNGKTIARSTSHSQRGKTSLLRICLDCASVFLPSVV